VAALGIHLYPSSPIFVWRHTTAGSRTHRSALLWQLPLISFMGDGLDICPRRRFARWLTAAQTPAYAYEFRWRLRCPSFDGIVVDLEWGAVHESELYFIFPQYSVRARTSRTHLPRETLRDADYY
jgi:hypothetical protein